MPDWAATIGRISELIGQKLTLSDIQPVSGGCVNQAIRLVGGQQRYFVKYNSPSRLEMFIAEAEGLRALGAAGAVRVPAPVCWGTGGGIAFLVLELVELAPAVPTIQEELGRRLAALHRVTHPRFGWHRDNTIGATAQINRYADHWPEFFRDRRLAFQLHLAADQGYRAVSAKGEQLLTRLDAFFRDYAPPASLLHGDLWYGNVAATAGGEPVIFDPAVYFGDREADLAMTELFGGFAAGFYRAYAEAWPLAPGYAARRTLYNLYHVLNHLNLFGASYRAQAERMIEQLLAQVR